MTLLVSVSRGAAVRGARVVLAWDVRVKRTEIVNAYDDEPLRANDVGLALERAAAGMASYGGELVPGSVRVEIVVDE